MNYKNIIEEIVMNQGMIRDIFGDEDRKKIVYDQELENNKNILKNVYGFKDIDYIFPWKIEKSKLEKVLNTVFRHIEAQKQESLLSKMFTTNTE